MAAANAALAALAGNDSQRGRKRFVASLTWRGAPRAFLRALRLGRALATLTGDVSIDIETRVAPLRAPARRRCSRAGRGDASPCGRSEARDAAAAAAEARAAASGAAGASADDDAFEDVRLVRRCTLEQFYSYLLPALQQVAADAAHTSGNAGAPADDDATAASEDGEAAGGLCSICYDARVDTVSPCAHAFCAECYARWRARSPACALCRGTLPPERGGCGAWVLPDATADVPTEPRVTPAALAAWLQALPAAT